MTATTTDRQHVCLADPAAAVGGLYVHVPFCLEKCGYCDFYSLKLDDERVDATAAALIAELEAALGEADFAIRTIFVGGGTPTVLPRPAFDRLFERLGEVARAAGAIEFTVEANPATLDAGKAELLAAAGVNRISLGAQSFRPFELKVLDRTHHPGAVEESLAIAAEAGIAHRSIDLIFGTPGQTPRDWAYSLKRAAELPIDHISCYNLTYEPGTALTARRDRGLLAPIDEDTDAELFEMTAPLLADAGFERYEVSNFVRPSSKRAGDAMIDDHQTPSRRTLEDTSDDAWPTPVCQHNLHYWNNQPYLNVGPSAVGFVRGERRKNAPNLRQWLAAIEAGTSPVVERETYDTAADFADDLAWLRLRLSVGIAVAAFERRTGIDPRQRYAAAIQRHVAGGLLIDTGTHLRLTEKGWPLANRVSGDFLVDD